MGSFRSLWIIFGPSHVLWSCWFGSHSPRIAPNKISQNPPTADRQTTSLTVTVVDRIVSPLEQETAYTNGFRPASVPLQSLAVKHMAKVKSSKIVQYVCTISRLCKCIAQSQDCLRNLEIGTQFQDSENAQRNLEIAQIPKLRGTYSPAIFRSANILGIQYRREAEANHVLCGHDARRGLSIEEQGCGVAEQLGDGLGGALN